MTPCKTTATSKSAILNLRRKRTCKTINLRLKIQGKMKAINGDTERTGLRANEIELRTGETIKLKLVKTAANELIAQGNDFIKQRRRVCGSVSSSASSGGSRDKEQFADNSDWKCSRIRVIYITPY